MYRGRGGPRQATPAHVQCQKCLKRGHYSYECKEPAGARPYVARPSRTQQLRNPSLVPKLTEDVPDDLQRKKGVADEELAKKEAERAKQRALKGRDDSDDDNEDAGESSRQRRRSISSESVSTISTNRSASPPPRRRSPSPARNHHHRRRRSPGDHDDDHRDRTRKRHKHSSHHGRSRSPNPRDTRPLGRDSRSPSPRRYESSQSGLESEGNLKHGGVGRGRRYSPSPSRDVSVSRSRSRSSSGSPAYAGDQRSNSPPPRRGHDRGHDVRGSRAGRPQTRRDAPREPSLSPFSKRKALTQSMHGGR